ncbi:uncharacterized protein LOC105233301 isoform X1 [Bactrocera dorsalis]|uniref:Uncharacterized protein LOC105233301 isoform X1 n=2 Tax=Bactrocera dorsalis TaxID=27457 RepID=A0A8N4LA55_BACDO|nr:uncharacterized protein LOC105233301 isoform X1 [Bactrocera dorsalis]
MMGCGSSMDTNSVIEEPIQSLERWQQGDMDPAAVIEEFVRLDERISKLEATCPGPRMATAEAWVEHLQSQRDSLLGVDTVDMALNPQNNGALQQQQQQPQQHQYRQQMNSEILTLNEIDATTPPPIHQPPLQPLSVTAATTATSKANRGALLRGNGATTNGVGGAARQANNSIVANTPTQDLANYIFCQLAINLGVVGDVNKASTHEDFFASLSESALYLTSIRYYTEILEHTKVRLKTLTESYNELNELYVHHDGIIAFISGGTYMTRLEESLDSQLEAARDVRDKLGSALEQWRICGTLLRTSATSATQALQQWQQLAKAIDPKHKIQLALECRAALQAALISVECAQLALPHVEIKHISNRQLLAVKHCNTYMITDIANLARYQHTSKVFISFESNASKASTWLYEMFNKTLRHDFDKAEETVRHLAKTLRDHREEVFTAARK